MSEELSLLKCITTYSGSYANVNESLFREKRHTKCTCTQTVRKSNTEVARALNFRVSDVLSFSLSCCPFKASLHGIVKMIPPNRIRGATQEHYHIADPAKALIHDD